MGYESESGRVLIATHHGLLAWKDDQLSRVGDAQHDFMGFSQFPANPKFIYTSGHPQTGGNLGVLKSEDGGLTFRQVYQGPSGQAVDFHSMTISPASHEVLYGWFGGQLYRTNDGGQQWQIFDPAGLPAQGLCWGAPCLNADSKDENKVYAGFPDGLFVSEDRGETWRLVSAEVGSVGGVGVSLANANQLFVFSQGKGVLVSYDGGQTWEERNEGLHLAAQEIVFGFAFDADNPERVYLATTNNQLYISENTGRTWSKLL